jgi:polysaccharide deacetylase family protein (PEP-CTERM system associated)
VRNVLTVDVEEWFHVCGVGGALAPDRWPSLPSRVERTTELVLELLARRGITATFFVLGWIADRHPGVVAAILSAGHEIASHGWSHRRVYELDPASFEDELTRAAEAILAAGAPQPAGFRAAEWSINDRSLWALDVLARRGYQYDASMSPLRLVGNPAYPQRPHWRATAAGDLLEVPPLVARRMGQNFPLGGGWGLRMSAPATVEREIAARNRRGEPVTIFVHPWELDPEPPRAALPWALRFSHYFRLAGFGERLNDILGRAEFGPIRALPLAAVTTRVLPLPSAPPGASG